MYIVMGNGESRKAIPYSKLENHITYGCNALYRDWTPTKLISIDNKIIFEIISSGFCKKCDCYFKNFNLMEASVADMLLMSLDQNVEKHINKKTDYMCAFFGQEKTIEFCDDTHSMSLADKPQYYIMYVDKNDRITSIDDMPIEPMDSGLLATNICAYENQPDEIYLIGFDFNNNDGKVNNIYKNTDCYAPSYALPVQANGWISDMQYLFDKYSNTKFIHVQDSVVFDTVETMSVDNFKALL